MRTLRLFNILFQFGTQCVIKDGRQMFGIQLPTRLRVGNSSPGPDWPGTDSSTGGVSSGCHGPGPRTYAARR